MSSLSPQIGLMTVPEIAQEYGICISSSGSALRHRGLRPAERKETGSGGSSLYKVDEVKKAFALKPYSKRLPKPQGADNGPLLGEKQPFRNIKCSKYEKCYSAAAISSKPLDCSDCDLKNDLSDYYKRRGGKR